MSAKNIRHPKRSPCRRAHCRRKGLIERGADARYCADHQPDRYVDGFIDRSPPMRLYRRQDPLLAYEQSSRLAAFLAAVLARRGR